MCIPTAYLVKAHGLDMMWTCTLTKAGWARVTANVIAPRTGIVLRVELGATGSLTKGRAAIQAAIDMAALCLELKSEKEALPGLRPRIHGRATSEGSFTTIRRKMGRSGAGWRIVGHNRRMQTYSDRGHDGSTKSLLTAYRELRAVLIPDRHGVGIERQYWALQDPFTVQEAVVCFSGREYRCCKFLALRQGSKPAWLVRFGNQTRMVSIREGSDGSTEYQAATEFLHSVYLSAPEGEWMSTSHPEIPMMTLPHPLRIARRSWGKGKPAQLGIALPTMLNSIRSLIWLPLRERSLLTKHEIDSAIQEALFLASHVEAVR